MLLLPREVYLELPAEATSPATYLGRHGMRDIMSMIRPMLRMEAVSFHSNHSITILWRAGNSYRCLYEGGAPAPVVVAGKYIMEAFGLPEAARVELVKTRGDSIPSIQYSVGDPPQWVVPELKVPCKISSSKLCKVATRTRSQTVYVNYPGIATVRRIAYSMHGLRPDGAIIAVVEAEYG